MSSTAVPPATCPDEWMRIYATRLAQRRPDIPAEEIVRKAIGEFKASGHLPPETAAAKH